MVIAECNRRFTAYRDDPASLPGDLRGPVLNVVGRYATRETYDQLHVEKSDLGGSVNYLKEGDTAILMMYSGRVVGVELPAAVELSVTNTEPGVQGDRVSGARKPATLETGLVVQVPLFVEPGERIKVDTRTGEYLARA